MKHYYTFFFSFAFLLVFSTSGIAQESHTVIVENSAFTPSLLNINQGDTVHWINTQGSHNVNGTQQTFPDNPESFGNEVGSGWQYTFVFDTPGTYEYHCDVHAPNMAGSVIVSPSSGVEESAAQKESSISIYPNPATDFVIFDFSGSEENRDFIKVTVYNSVGALVEVKELKESEKIRFITSGYQAGLYTYQIEQSGKVTRTGQFLTR